MITKDEVSYESFCPQCGLRYTTPDKDEPSSPDRLCPKCFDAWPGMTMEELQNGF